MTLEPIAAGKGADVGRGSVLAKSNTHSNLENQTLALKGKIYLN
jgi:hypothetical protein